MFRILQIGLLAAIGSTLTFYCLDAWSCSPGWSVERHRPVSATEVPTNAVLHLVGPMPRPFGYLAHLTTTSTSGLVRTTTLTPQVSLDKSLWGLDDLDKIPLPNLRPSSTATVALVQGLGMPGSGDPVIVLQVGSEADLTPPVLAGSLTISYRFEEAEPMSACYPWDRFVLSTRFPSATDDYGIAAYGLYENKNGQLVLIGTDLHVPGSQEQWIRRVTGVHIRPDEGLRCFAVIAYDYAGNASLPSETCIDMRRPSMGTQPDAGAASQPSLDAGSDVTVGSSPSEDSGASCANIRQHPEDGILFLSLLLMAGLMVRRRTRQN